MYILSWNVKKVFNALYTMIENEQNNNILIEWFGKENWTKLLNSTNGNTNEAMDWVKSSLKSTTKATLQLFLTIFIETKDNELVQKRLNAAGINESTTTELGL